MSILERRAPLISVVMPSFNQGRFIEQSIRSVLDGGYPNVELIVIDGGSADETLDVVARYRDRLAWFVSEPDRGQVHAINKGFARAKGEIYAYLNSDDLYEPGILGAAAEAFLAAPRPDRHWIASNVVEFSSLGEQLVVPPKELALIRWITRQAGIHQPGTFWSATLYKEIGGFDESYNSAFDRKFFMEMVARGCLPEVLSRVGARFRIHDASKTGVELNNSLDGAIFVDEFVRISREFLPKLTPQERQQVHEYRRQQTMSRVLRGLERRRGAAAALAFAGASLRVFPTVVGTRFFWGAVKGLLRADG